MGMRSSLRKKSKTLRNLLFNNIFPRPQKAVERPGTLRLSSVRSWQTEENSFEEVIRFFARRIGFSEHANAALPQLLIRKECFACPEAYELRISPDGILLAAAQKTGVFRALTTLSQFMEGQPSAENLPCIEIKDAPVLKTRGFMLDVSRCKVPSMKTILELIDLLAELRFNQLQLYVEHTFAFRDHETVWKDASPLREKKSAKSINTAKNASSNWFPISTHSVISRDGSCTNPTSTWPNARMVSTGKTHTSSGIMERPSNPINQALTLLTPFIRNTCRTSVP